MNKRFYQITGVIAIIASVLSFADVVDVSNTTAGFLFLVLGSSSLMEADKK